MIRYKGYKVKVNSFNSGSGWCRVEAVEGMNAGLEFETSIVNLEDDMEGAEINEAIRDFENSIFKFKEE